MCGAFLSMYFDDMYMCVCVLLFLVLFWGRLCGWVLGTHHILIYTLPPETDQAQPNANTTASNS